MPRFKLDSDEKTILEDGRAVATVTGGGTDEGARLVSLLNMADRDEVLLDQLGETITSRNLV